MPRPKRTFSSGLGAPLYTIEVPNAQPEIVERTTDLMEDCRYIGSYDWAPNAEKGRPIIVVPGKSSSPNVWFDPELPLRVDPDVGIHMRDRNSHILRGQPLLPLLVAVNEQQIFPREDWKTVDFVTDRNGLRKLLRWIMKASGRDFRIDTQLVGNKTVVLNRRELSTTERMSGFTFGFSFEKATTMPMSPSTRHSISHHRIVTYKFGRFRMVVQFEVDACLSQQQSSTSTEDELVNAMATMGLQSQVQGTASIVATPASAGRSAMQRKSTAFGLTVHHQGRADIPHSSVVEMATTASTNKTRWDDRYPQLYFSQTGNHHFGHHQSGMFHRIDKLGLTSPELQAVHRKLQPALKKLEEALAQIQSIVVEHGKEEKLSLVYEHKNLAVYRNSNQFNCFPTEALALFN